MQEQTKLYTMREAGEMARVSNVSVRMRIIFGEP